MSTERCHSGPEYRRLVHLVVRRVTLALCLFWAAAASADRELIVWGQGRDRGLDAALRQFEVEHPGWKVITTSGSTGGMDPQKLMTGIAGGAPPDLVRQDRFSVGEWAVRDAFVPLDDRVLLSVHGEELARRAHDALAAGDSLVATTTLEARLDAVNDDDLDTTDLVVIGGLDWAAAQDIHILPNLYIQLPDGSDAHLQARVTALFKF